MNRYEVLLVIDGINDKTGFEKHLKKEGFLPIKGEDFAYQGTANLPLMNTRAYIFDVLKKAMSLSDTKTCSFVCQLGTNPIEKYQYNTKLKNFIEID